MNRPHHSMNKRGWVNHRACQSMGQPNNRTAAPLELPPWPKLGLDHGLITSPNKPQTRIVLTSSNPWGNRTTTTTPLSVWHTVVWITTMAQTGFGPWVSYFSQQTTANAIRFDIGNNPLRIDLMKIWYNFSNS